MALLPCFPCKIAGSWLGTTLAGFSEAGPPLAGSVESNPGRLAGEGRFYICYFLGCRASSARAGRLQRRCLSGPRQAIDQRAAENKQQAQRRFGRLRVDGVEQYAS